MRGVWGVDMPAGAEDYPGPGALRERFRRCSCGQMTFLPLPCRSCGAETPEPVYRYTMHKARLQRAKRWTIAVPFFLGTCALAALIWWPLVVPTGLVTLGALLYDVCRKRDELDYCYWLFHQEERQCGSQPMLLPSIMDEISSAYDGDLYRLEQALARGPSRDRAIEIYNMGRELAFIYHNRRVSALLLRCLLLLPLSEGLRIDLDRICAFLEPEDFPDGAPVLTKLAECARFTCLLLGEPVARFVVRVCASRVQEAALQEDPDASVREASSALELEQLFSQEERQALSLLWTASATGGTLSESAKRPLPSLSCETPLCELPLGSNAVAERWAQQVWDLPGSKERTAFDQLIAGGRNRLGELLAERWGRGEAR